VPIRYVLVRDGVGDYDRRRSNATISKKPQLTSSVGLFVLVHQGDLCRSPSSSRRGNSSSMVRSRNCTNNPGLGRPVLAHRAMDARAPSHPAYSIPGGSLVSGATPHLQRCTCPRSPRTLDAAGFRRFRKRTKAGRNTSNNHQRPDRSGLLSRVDGQSGAYGAHTNRTLMKNIQSRHEQP